MSRQRKIPATDDPRWELTGDVGVLGRGASGRRIVWAEGEAAQRRRRAGDRPVPSRSIRRSPERPAHPDVPKRPACSRGGESSSKSRSSRTSAGTAGRAARARAGRGERPSFRDTREGSDLRISRQVPRFGRAFAPGCCVGDTFAAVRPCYKRCWVKWPQQRA